jgi:hypothetical protein
MDLLPEVHVLGPSDFIAERAHFPGRDAALDSITPSDRDDAAAVRQRLAARFDDFFVEENGVYVRRRAPSRVLLITWEPSKR